MKPLTMFRARGITGAFFNKNASLSSSLIHSTGNYIGSVGGEFTPRITLSIISDGARSVVRINFNGIPGGALNTGVTYTVDGGIPQTFSTAIADGNGVNYTAASAFNAGDVVRWIYSPGNITVEGPEGPVALEAQDVLVMNNIIGAPTATAFNVTQNEVVVP